MAAGRHRTWESRRKRIGFLAAGLLLLGALLSGCALLEGNNAGSPGLFSWSKMEDETARGALLAAAGQLHLSEIYQYYKVSDLQALTPESLVSELNRAKVDVYFLMGEPEWGLEGDGEHLCRYIEEVSAYNAAVAQEARFTGVVIDAEPYLCEEWDDDRSAVLVTWCQALCRAKIRAEQAGLRVILCLPRWLDTVDEDSLRVMLRDGCDAAAIMNYGRKDEIAAIETEVALAAEYGRELIHISELKAPGEQAEENSEYYQDLSDVELSWEKLQAAYPDANLRFAYHHWTPLQKILDQK